MMLPVLVKEPEKRGPFLPILILSHIAAGRVEKDGLIREPPVTISRAPDAANTFAGFTEYGKLQARVQ
jgi:hypothetical protein